MDHKKKGYWELVQQEILGYWEVEQATKKAASFPSKPKPITFTTSF